MGIIEIKLSEVYDFISDVNDVFCAFELGKKWIVTQKYNDKHRKYTSNFTYDDALKSAGMGKKRTGSSNFYIIKISD
ncbi:hypothetical protein [Serratia fonticola]|uniref:hypothetical protein n=1 Tax=Serratia fonticola TaxID=47917 RepID=UPI00093E8000|nr:hypothetical protein [Serratia fonticola]OKP21777.1 hypothetical protein BSQ40_25450 [Serratia fonticola]